MFVQFTSFESWSLFRKMFAFDMKTKPLQVKKYKSRYSNLLFSLRNVFARRYEHIANEALFPGHSIFVDKVRRKLFGERWLRS